MVPSVSATGLTDELSLIFLIVLKVYGEKKSSYSGYEILSKLKDKYLMFLIKSKSDAGNLPLIST